MAIMANRGSATQVVDLERRTAIPRLNDLRVHLILGGSEFQHGAALEGGAFDVCSGSGLVSRSS